MYHYSKYCKEFVNASRYVYKWLKKQPTVGEESITDWLLYVLSEALPSLKYMKFSRHIEAKETGADWEWWIVDDTKALCLRIQAKKVTNKDNYNSIAYTNKYGMQIEMLMEDAKRKNAIPLYALYYASTTEIGNKCKYKRLYSKEACGIFVSSAKSLYSSFIEKGKKPVTDKDIIRQSDPIHCLFCYGGEINVDSVYENLRIYYDKKDLEVEDEEGIHNTVPNYIDILLKNENISEWYEDEFRYNLQNINAIFITDLRINSN